MSDSDEEVDSDLEADKSGAAPPLDHDSTSSLPVDDHTLALQAIVRLRQPFNALLLLQQSAGVYKRVAVENEIVVQVFRDPIRPKDIQTEVLYIR
ncbi:hypothetical protein OG21DRAFT_1518190 [Imleria badia]|nr:hypothetical protein OG21DRAFT_1518190 [Imleria badia]